MVISIETRLTWACAPFLEPTRALGTSCGSRPSHPLEKEKKWRRGARGGATRYLEAEFGKGISSIQCDRTETVVGRLF